MAKQKEGFFQGIIYLMSSQMIVKILGMIYSLYLTNQKGFGDEGNAISMAGFQFYALLLGICAIGVPNAVSKLVSETLELGEKNTCNEILRVSLVIFTLISFGICMILYLCSDFIANHILSISSCSGILKILAPSIVFSTVESVYRGYFNGIHRISLSARSATLEQICKTVLTIFFVKKIGKITNFNTELMAKGSMLAVSISTIFSFLYSYIQYKRIKLVSPKEKYSQTKTMRRICKEIFSIMIPISLTTGFMLLGNNIDSITIIKILKSKIGEVQARNVYGIITSKINLMIGLPLALNGAISVSLIPEISRNIAKEDNHKLEKNINFSFLMTLIISVPMMMGMMFYAKDVMRFLYPNAPKGAELLQLASLTIVFSCITQNISGILQGAGNSKTHLQAVKRGIILKLCLNLFLIPNKRLLEKGAIISTLITNLFIFVMMYHQLKKTFMIRFSLYPYLTKLLIIAMIAILVTKNILKNIGMIFKVKFILELIFFGSIFGILVWMFMLQRKDTKVPKKSSMV